MKEKERMKNGRNGTTRECGWCRKQIKKTQDELQWIVAQRLLSALTIPGFSYVVCKRFIIPKVLNYVSSTSAFNSIDGLNAIGPILILVMWQW